MGRLIVRYQDGGTIRWAELDGNPPTSAEDIVTIRPLAIEAGSTREFLDQITASPSPAGSPVKLEARQILSPVTSDASIYAQGLNYQAHAEEAQHAKRKSNLIFSKASSSLTGPFGDIVRPAEVELLDYEVEFGIVLRRDLLAKEIITAETIGSAVAGIVLCNDVSARDTMFGTTFLQWFRGKSYRTFCPVGPVLWLLQPEEVAQALSSLEIKLWVNGELRQSATSDQLIFGPAETLTYIASSIDLHGGDLLLTGTPGGVTAPATARMVEILKDHLLADDARRDALRIEMVKTRPFLKPGDVVTATLTQGGVPLGGLSNRVADER